MELSNIQEWILPFTLSMGAIFSVMSFFFAKIKGGNDDARKNLNETLQETTEAYKEKIDLLMSQVGELQAKYNEMKIEFTKVRQERDTYKEIFAGGDIATRNHRKATIDLLQKNLNLQERIAGHLKIIKKI